MCRRAHNQCRMSERRRYEYGAEYPQTALGALANEARPRTGVTHRQTEIRAHAHTPWCTRTTPQQRPPLTPRCVGVQRLEVLVAVILARERRALAHAEDSGCTELAAALATLPSGLLEMVADAVAALGHADA